MEQKKAQIITRSAIKNGHLINPKELFCVDCGKQAYCYDHRFYSKPLEVVPVCHSCNVKRGPALDRKQEAIKRIVAEIPLSLFNAIQTLRKKKKMTLTAILKMEIERFIRE